MKSSKIKCNAGRNIGLCAIGLMLFAVCGCEKPVPAKTPDTASVTMASPPAATPPPTEHEASVHVSDEFRKVCALPDEPREAPRFDFDQATLRSRGENILDDVAVCLKEGPLKGRTISIIGRADPRGSQQHNKELGTSRAEAARNYLVEHGVPTASMNVSSRGELGATGTDEASWELDRRVDLELGSR